MAERAATLTQRQDPVALDTLGVAYASTGQFDRAIAAAEMALALGANGPLADEVRARLAGYRAQRPYQR
jgi:Flp pilus assembly protein TadD